MTGLARGPPFFCPVDRVDHIGAVGFAFFRLGGPGGPKHIWVDRLEAPIYLGFMSLVHLVHLVHLAFPIN